VVRAIPSVARDLGLASDKVTPNTIEEIVETLVIEHALRIQPKSDNDDQSPDSAKALEDILNPDVSLAVVEVAPALVPTPQGETLLDQYDGHAKRDPHDPWVLAVEGQPEGKIYWKMALALVYQTVKGADRKEWRTWALVERTVPMLKRRPLEGISHIETSALDKDSRTGDNGNASPEQPSQPEKE